ncbi:AMP-binding enzyme [Myroides odoratimimus]|uniref:AMP-binding enzyme n=1 Tax=Myroides odoratimimus TaxID=76832 RepID=UPI0033075853
MDLKVIDEDGVEVPKDGKTLGEIVVRAPYLTMGYYKDKKKSEELWDGGYLHTGDIAWIDENNDVKIVDRSKDVIKTGGEWMSSLALEEMISSYPGVVDAAVIGIPDDKWGERPFALVVAKVGVEIVEKDLVEHMQKYVDKQVINKWAIPDRFVFVDDIPKTSVGKISKKRIRELHELNQLR